MADTSVSVIAHTCACIYLELHDKPVSQVCPDGVWEHLWKTTDGQTMKIRQNGTGESREDLEPWGLTIYGNDWPIFVGNPCSGVVATMTEDDLICELAEHLTELQARESSNGT